MLKTLCHSILWLGIPNPRDSSDIIPTLSYPYNPRRNHQRAAFEPIMKSPFNPLESHEIPLDPYKSP